MPEKGNWKATHSKKINLEDYQSQRSNLKATYTMKKLESDTHYEN